MNMSMSEIYGWLVGLDFPSLSVIWTWLITVPWWLAILTIIIIVFAVRITWDMSFYFLNWIFDWTFKAGVRFAEWLQVFRGHMATARRIGKSIKGSLFP